MNWQASFPSAGRVVASVAIGLAVLLVIGLTLIPMAAVGGGSIFFSAGNDCPGGPAGSTTQSAVIAWSVWKPLTAAVVAGPY